MDITTLRSEIKAWEKDFRSSHGRDPTVQEIKDRPDMAEKYKLYKKLSKQTNASSSASTLAKPLPEDRRRTPPRDTSRPSTSSLLLSTSKHRAVKTEAPIATTNPFSPVKQRAKGGRTEENADSGLSTIPLILASSSRTQTNPFTTPSKPRPRASSSRKMLPPVLEEDPFPLIDAHTLASSSKPRLPQQPQIPVTSRDSQTVLGDPLSRPDQPNVKPVEDAVTRARKRLRGEPVSPSPVKEKRARTAVERVYSNAFGRSTLFDTLQAARDDESDEEYVRRGSEEEFIGETPAKPMKGGRAFVKLFDETLPSAALPHNRSKPPKPAAKGKPSSPGLFAFGFGSQGQSRSSGKKRAFSPPPAGDEDGMDVDSDGSEPGSQDSKLKAPDFRANGMAKSAKLAAKNGKSLAKAIIPAKSDLFDDASSTSSMAEGVERLAIKKRSAGSMEADTGDKSEDARASQRSSPSSLPLLPPSPPPVSSSGSKYTGDKGKASAKGLARKKAKLLELLAADGDSNAGETDGISDEEGEVRIKEVSRGWGAHPRRNRRDPVTGISGIDEGELVGSGPDPTIPYSHAALATYAEEQEKFEVDLPEHLREVLAITSHDPLVSLEDEEKLARGLIYGRREGHYDPTRGGEIWGAGEAFEEDVGGGFDSSNRIVHRHKDAEEDDDWEGDPVPWEIGEL